MARPPLPLGHHGNTKASRTGGRWVARCRYRGYDGVTRKLERWGGSRTEALAALQDELQQHRGERAVTVLRSTSRFNKAADIWIAKIHERRADSSAGTYEHWLKKVVRPQLGELLLRECGVATIDDFFRRLEREQKELVAADGTVTSKPRYAAISRRTVRSIISGILQQAVLHHAGCSTTSTPTVASSPRTCPTSSGSASAPACASARYAPSAGWTSTLTAWSSATATTCAAYRSSQCARTSIQWQVRGSSSTVGSRRWRCGSCRSRRGSAITQRWRSTSSRSDDEPPTDTWPERHIRSVTCRRATRRPRGVRGPSPHEGCRR